MDVCKNKVNSQYYILVEEEPTKLLLVTPNGEIKKFHKSAFDVPFDSNYKVFCLLGENQIHKYYDFLLVKGRSKYIEFANKGIDEVDDILERFVNLPLEEKWGFIQVMENIT